MPLITWYDKADLHREVAVAILDAFLPYGTKKSFSRQVGISLQWYSYIRQAGSFSMPDLDTANLMAKNLPTPEYYKESFYHHLSEARKAYENANREIHSFGSSRELLPSYLDEILDCHKEATFATNVTPDKVKRLYIKVLEMGETLINNVSDKKNPLEFLKLCNPLSDACYILDRLSDGLYWAKLGTRVAENLDIQTIKSLQDREALHRQHFITVRNEGVGYHNLRNPNAAQHCYNHAEILASSHNQAIHLSDVYRNRLISLSTLPRFAISEAESLANRAKDIFEKKNDYLSILMTEEALSRAYIVHGTSRSLKKASKMLETSLSGLDSINYGGQIHRVVIMQTVADLYWTEKNLVDWNETMKKLLATANDAGLFHQHRKAINKYGSAIKGNVNFSV